MDALGVLLGWPVAVACCLLGVSLLAVPVLVVAIVVKACVRRGRCEHEYLLE